MPLPLVIAFAAIFLVLTVLKASVEQWFVHKCAKCGSRFTGVDTFDTNDFSIRGVTHQWQVLVCMKPWCRHRKTLVGITVG